MSGISALAVVALREDPAAKTSRAGHLYYELRGSVADKRGRSIPVRVICYAAHLDGIATRLRAGQSVAVQGRLEAEAWIDGSGAARVSLTILADSLLPNVAKRRRPPDPIQYPPPPVRGQPQLSVVRSYAPDDAEPDADEFIDGEAS